MARIKFYNQNASSWEYADSTSGAGIDLVGYERIFYSTKRKPLEINHHDVNTSYIHGLYDALMAKYPDKVQKKEIASDDRSFTNYEYIISTGEYNTQGIRESTLDRHIKKPKYLIMGAIHGSERPTVISAYRFIKDLLEGQSALSHLAEGAVLHILPVAVPYGFDAFSYYNKDNININRNFTSESPALETQAICNWLQDNADAALYIDLHNQSVVNEVTTIFGRADKEKKIALRGLDRIIPYWRDVIKYHKTLMCRPLQGPEEAVVEQPVIFSNSVSFDIPSSAIQYASDVLSIPSITVETSIYQNGDYLDWMADKQVCTTETIAAGAEALGNILIEFFEQEVNNMTETNNKIDALTESINKSLSFYTESGTMVVSEDVLPASGERSITVKIPCSSGAKTVDFHADNDTLQAIKATEGTAYIGGFLANCYAPNIVNEAGQVRGLMTTQKEVSSYGWVLDIGSSRADNSNGLSFQCGALKAGTYYWIAYYWND